MKTSKNEFLFQGSVTILFTLFTILCVYPFYYIFLYSISDSLQVNKHPIYLLPAGFTLNNYTLVFQLKGIMMAFIVSSSRAIIGTVLTVFVCSMLAYALTKPKLVFRKLVYRILVVSMYINAGIIPWYIVMIKLGMKNNVLVYFLPFIVNVFLMILVKTFIEQIPAAIEESATMDGAGYFTIFVRVILPISKPILAAIAVFSAVNQWNSWIDNFFLVKNENLQTLQLTLLNFLKESEALANAATSGGDISGLKHIEISSMSIRMTVTMVVTIPIILVYPMLQKYFIKGIMLGAVKG